MASPWPIPITALGPAAAGCALWSLGKALRATVFVKVTLGVVHGRPAWPVSPTELVRRDRHPDKNPARSIDAASETAPYLPTTGVVLLGHAHAPGGRPALAMSVRFAIFREQRALLDKTLHVFGDRGAASAPPAPFQRMPLVYERAYGGPGVDDNPVGVGAAADSRAQPNLVDPRDARRPIGLGPVSRYWPGRKRLLGTADRRKLDQAIVEVPNGFDWRYFHAAPPDQQIEYLQGDEWLVLDGLHPELSRVQTRLPGARAEARWHRVGPAGASAGTSIDLVLDTLTLDADLQICSLVWRGSFPLESVDAARSMRVCAGVDLPGYPIVWPEPGALAAQPFEPAAAPSRVQAVHPLGATSALGSDEESTAAARPAAPFRRGAPAEGGADPDPLGRTRMLSQDEDARGAAKPAAPFALPTPGPRARAVAPIPGAPWSRDAGRTLHRAPRWQSGGPRPGTPLDRTHDDLAPVPERTRLRDVPRVDEVVGENIEEVADENVEEVADENVEEVADENVEEVAGGSVEHAVGGSAERAVGGSAERAVGGSAEQAVGAAPPPPAAVSGVRGSVIARLAAGDAFHDLDLTGADLSDLDFDGRSLGGVTLTGANMQRSTFVGARLAEANLAGADLTGADLTGADLTRAKLTRATLVGARVDRATLADADLSSASGAGATFSGATAPRATFARGRWERARFDTLDGTGADFTGAGLDHASFADATLGAARFVDARGTGVTFDRARMREARLEGATLGESSFEGIDGAASVWERARLDGSRFVGAVLRDASFLRATANLASFARATLVSANLQRLVADGADLSGADLERSDLRQAKLHDASFDDAVLRTVQAARADLSRSRFRRADLRGALLRPSKLRQCDLAAALVDGTDLRDSDLEQANLFGVDRARAKTSGANLKDVSEVDPGAVGGGG